jgi:ACS family glucarate transporter-like MFS transporter
MMIASKRMIIYVLLLCYLAISIMDRMNMSVAGSSIAAEWHLTPTGLGYLFSSFFWIYIICLLPAGALTDRLGSRRTAAWAMGLWSVFQMCTGLALGLTSMIFTRLGLGVFETAQNPVANLVIRQWAPRSERAFATSVWSIGNPAGSAFGALFVAWLVSTVGWRVSFIATGLIGLAWMLTWLLLFRLPEHAGWVGERERAKIVAERDLDLESAAETAPGMGFRGLLATRTMWGMAITQGCSTYVTYFLLTWLPGYMQMSRGLSIMGSGVYTALPFAGAMIFSLLLSHLCDRMLDQSKVPGGQRRYAVAIGSLATAVVLLVPFASSLGMAVVLLTISITFTTSTQTWNFALVNDLLEGGADVGRATACLTVGGNAFGLLAPIITGYVVSATGSFTIPFVLCGMLAVAGAVCVLSVVRNAIGK